ncbi:MAG: S8 family peptidase [Solirubrobacteraceae bacterium]
MARAETPITTQAQADNGAFLAYAAPPAKPAGVCLIDTGVDLNPDTQSTVVERTALDGGNGNDVSPSLHGTVLAMMAAAPANGWGMVGTAPTAIKIASVRILEPGETSFPFTSYAAGIRACLQMPSRLNIRVINLSLGTSETPSSESYEIVRGAVEIASHYGVAVTAAAGNDDGGPVGYPAAEPGVLAVGASDTLAGGYCSFSNHGPGLRMLAPGCELDGADPTTGTEDFNYWQGTSEASAIDASALAALLAYRPDLTPEAAEEDLADANAGSLDIAQAFRNAGLGQIVTKGEAAEPHSAAGGITATEAASPQNLSTVSLPAEVLPAAEIRLKAPMGHLLRRKKHLLLVLANGPREAHTEVCLLGYRGHSRKLKVLRTIDFRATTLEVLASGVRELRVRYTDPYDIQRSSTWTTLRPAAKQASRRP